MCEHWHRTPSWSGQIKGTPNRSRNVAVNQINCQENQHVDLRSWNWETKSKSRNSKSAGKQWQITNYGIDMGIIIIIIIIIVHIQGPVGEFPRIYSGATVFIWIWNWVLVLVFCFFFPFIVGICCVFIFLEAHYLTAAQRWTKNENWPKIEAHKSPKHTHTPIHTLLFGVESLTARRKISLFPNGSQMATTTATSRYFIKPHKSKSKGIRQKAKKHPWK